MFPLARWHLYFFWGHGAKHVFVALEPSSLTTKFVAPLNFLGHAGKQNPTFSSGLSAGHSGSTVLGSETRGRAKTFCFLTCLIGNGFGMSAFFRNFLHLSFSLIPLTGGGYV